MEEPRRLPPPPELATGTFQNGLTYYVWNCPEPQSFCEFRLCVAVGSWYEDDAESGLSHLVEHMAFKTTERFREMREIVRFLEARGAQYGHDLNASTGLFDTTYRFQLPLRDGALGDLDHGLDVLAEWASGIRATEEDVESERPVILEEWRTKRGAKERLKSIYWRDAVAPRVAARFPIGDLNVIRAATTEQVRAFYRQWYRPERMAVVVVGDFGTSSSCDVVARLQNRFSALATALPSSLILEPPQPRPGFVTCFLQDAEVTASSVSLELLHPLLLSADIGHLEREVARRLLTTILDRRFSAILARGASRSGKCPPGILDLALSSRPLLPKLLCTSVTATVSSDPNVIEKSVVAAITFLLRELRRIAQHGVSANEVERASASWLQAFSSERPVHGAELAEECLQHFKLGAETALAGPKAEAQACREFLVNGKTEAAILSLAQELQPGAESQAWRLCVQCGPGPNLNLEALLASGLAAADAEPVLPFEQEHSGGNVNNNSNSGLDGREAALTAAISADVATARHDFTIKSLSELGAVEFTLSNGVVVCCLRRKTPNKVALQGFVLGGSTELDEFDECAMCVLDDVALAAGFSEELDGVALAELQSMAQTRVNTQRHLYHRGLGGSTTSGRLGLLLKLVFARLRSLKCNSSFRVGATAAVERAKARFREDIRQRANCPHFELGQRARIISCGGVDVPVLRPVSSEAVDAMSVERCTALHERAFSSLGAFTFVLVGDLPADDELGQLLASHLGRAPAGVDCWLPADRAVPESLPAGFADGIVEERIISKSAEKATVLLIFHVSVPREDAGPAHLDAVLIVQAACRCAEERLLRRLRGEEQGVYTVSVTFGRNSLSPHGHITISFDCDPARRSVLVATVLREVRELQEAGPSAAEAGAVASALTDTQDRHLKGTSANSYWLFYLLEAYKGERLRQAFGVQEAMHSEASARAPSPCDSSRVEATARAASLGYAERVRAIVTQERLRVTFVETLSLANYVQLVLEPPSSDDASSRDPPATDDNVDGKVDGAVASKIDSEGEVRQEQHLQMSSSPEAKRPRL
eukprot:TRINITY_DN72564_c0_g1_i1.p1 TRINITY_DN72564_c0_g1~~TRINITY_DN72564_c0_g1_i1.p1  ORF type:complete len:1068 (+),score=165.84 TRINITY_DN72564_c0_g1_i1:39-3206(+)